MIPPLQPHQPSGQQATRYDITATQEAVRRVLDEIANTRRPQLSSEIIEATSTGAALSLTAGIENLVEHGLGRAVRGWRLVDLQGSAIVWRVASPSTTGFDATKYLALACSSDVTIKLEVF